MGVPMMLYFADPMCSWCWGFNPVMARVREAYGERFDLSLVVGGLSPHETRPLDARTRASVREHWQHVHEASGQPFDFGFFDRTGFVYNTEPACRAIVAARRLEPGSEFRMLHALHVAFYAANRDVTDETVLTDVASGLGFAREQFAACLDDQVTRLETGNDFMATQSIGIQGFPALVVGDEETGLTGITVGYQDYEPIAHALDAWLAGRAAE
ncbi:MAG: DsbA family protein [Gammaproteobacteria bacterium]